MITLYRFGELGLKCDPSPYCLKLDAYLKLSGLEYTVKKGAEALRTAPKGKLPFITDGEMTMGDSNLIIEYLKEKYGDTLGAHLSKEEQAITKGFTSLLEDAIATSLGQSRWMIDKNWLRAKDIFFGKMSAPLKWIIPTLARKGAVKNMSQGAYKGFTQEELFGKADKGFKALSDFLGDKKYFFGEKASSLDVAVYATMAQFYLIDDFTGDIYDHAKKYPNLEKFTHDFHQSLNA